MKTRINPWMTIFILLSTFILAGISAGAGSDKTPSEKCASCHSNSPAFKQWQKSGHANSLENLLKDTNVAWSCLKCHSSDYNAVMSNPWLSTSQLPTPQSARNSVSCSSCHKHDTGIEHNLIMPADKLCSLCHVLFCGG